MTLVLPDVSEVVPPPPAVMRVPVAPHPGQPSVVSDLFPFCQSDRHESGTSLWFKSLFPDYQWDRGFVYRLLTEGILVCGLLPLWLQEDPITTATMLPLASIPTSPAYTDPTSEASFSRSSIANLGVLGEAHLPGLSLTLKAWYLYGKSFYVQPVCFVWVPVPGQSYVCGMNAANLDTLSLDLWWLPLSKSQDSKLTRLSVFPEETQTSTKL